MRNLPKSLMSLLTTATVALSSLGASLPRAMAHGAENPLHGEGKNCQVFTIEKIPEVGLQLNMLNDEATLSKYGIELGVLLPNVDQKTCEALIPELHQLNIRDFNNGMPVPPSYNMGAFWGKTLIPPGIFKVP